MPHQLGKRLLVLDHVAKIVEIAGRLVLDERPPEVEHLAGTRRRLDAGQLFAHQHGDRFADRRVFLPFDTGKIRLRVFFRMHRIEVGGHAGHPQCADRFDARLFDRIEHDARIGALRRHAGMRGRVMAGDSQRHGIAEPTGHREFVRRRSLGDFRQANALAGKARTLVGERDLDFSVAGDRPHAAGDRPPQRLGIDRTARLGFRIVSATCHDLVLSTPSGPTLRERCWRHFPSARRRMRAGTVRRPACVPVRRTC